MPTVADDFVATDPGAPLSVNVIANDSDIDGDSLAVDDVGELAHGTTEIVDARVRDTPDAGFTGVDDFTYTLIDAHGGASTASAHVGVGTFPTGAPLETISCCRTRCDGQCASCAPPVPINGW